MASKEHFRLCHVLAFFISIGCFIYVLYTFIEKKNMNMKIESEGKKLNSQRVPMIPESYRNGAKRKNTVMSQQNPAFAHISFNISQGKEFPEFKEDHMILKLRLDGFYHGVNVTSSGITIHYSGLYYVFSSISFSPAGIRCSGLSYQHFFYYITRTLQSNSVTLLKVAHTCSDSEHTKFLGGVFHLEAGDVVTASCSGHNLVKENQESSFMGLFMLKAMTN